MNTLTSTQKHSINQPVVFFPGTLCDERVFHTCWQHLDSPMRAFVPLQWANDLPEMKMLSADRLDYFEQPAHLVGFSMGGYIAALTALENPEKVASITLIGSACDELPKAELERRKLLLKVIAEKKYKGMTPKYLASVFHPNNQANKEYFELVKQMEHDLGFDVLTKQIKSTDKRKNLLPALAKSRTPIQLICGEQDTLVSKGSLNAVHRQLPNSDLTIVEGAGHMLPIEQPRVLADCLAAKLNA